MKTIITIHTITAIIAFFIGFYVLIKPKGVGKHKMIGWLFIVTMFVSLLSSFFIQSEGRFSWIHVLSVLGLYWIGKAIFIVRYKTTPNWKYVHASNMVSAYISTIIAGAGVLGRHFIFPGNTTYGFYLSVFVAIPTIYIAQRQLYIYYYKKS